MKFIFTLLLCCLFVGQAEVSAQEYKTAVGIRLGSPLALSLKAFPFNDHLAIEAMLGYRNRNYFGYKYSQYSAGGLLQWHGDPQILDGLRYYIGGGASAYVWKWNDDIFGDGSSDVRVGAHGNIGLDYAFPDTPINVSIDYVPTFFVGEEYLESSFSSHYALSARYVLGR
ncbi:outer membrane protein W [Lewinella aquimaris]|uniref:Outer membrane protein W n=1 Tax=Neolewinella aquimaris TaxID=1835722 RepID=A0A840EBW1_9BACT|nr:hypothetical protein [Neolewinella aquimaris]MBB4080995.1 outer membrane protein W [Neolewinella aquimaris]